VRTTIATSDQNLQNRLDSNVIKIRFEVSIETEENDLREENFHR